MSCIIAMVYMNIANELKEITLHTIDITWCRPETYLAPSPPLGL
jgi:hypothetical protein